MRFAFVFLVLGSGCLSLNTLGSARPLPRGQRQVFFSQAALRKPDELLPFNELGGRIGLSDDAELGGKVYPLGIAVDAKVAVLRPASSSSRDPLFGLHLVDRDHLIPTVSLRVVQALVGEVDQPLLLGAVLRAVGHPQ